MTLGVRKLIVVGLIVLIVLLANALIFANWLDEVGAVDWASRIRREYATGTAIAVILALLVLLVSARQVVTGATPWIRRCPVSDHVLLRRGKYCPECGNRVCGSPLQRAIEMGPRRPAV